MSGQSVQISARPASLAPPALPNQIAQTSAHFNRCRIPFLCIMENYTLKTSISISKPIVFLCGPYISKNKREDRRIILQQKLLDICDKKVLPLIIDEFLTKENLNFDVNIELLEEIFATISDKTHVFLDTMATAAESGLFMNHMMKSKNRLSIYVPYKNEVFEKGRLGYFIRDVFIGMNRSQIDLVEYHPSIRRVALYTDYAVEHFYFIGNELPYEILKSIELDKPNEIVTNLLLKKADEFSANPWEISYSYDNTIYSLKVYTSIKLLFYVVASILYTNYGDELKEISPAMLDDFDIEDISRAVNDAYKHYVYVNTAINAKECELKTPLNVSVHDVIYHITAFIYVYHHFATLRGIRFLNKPEIMIEKVGTHPFTVFNITDDELNLIDGLLDDSALYYDSITINKRGKKRELIVYKNTDDGKKLRKFHERINSVICNKYRSNEASYAYQRGKSITMCVSKHVQNKYFAKYDIKKFFNSIKQDHLIKAIENEFGIDERYREATGKIVCSFFVNGRLPLGLITSPILSDIYMKNFDCNMVGYAVDNGYVYTRYADDIMLSTRLDSFSSNIDLVEGKLKSLLADLDLKLNLNKRRIEVLDVPGRHIRYVGINIICGKDHNFLTVGKKYIYDTAKEYLNYLNTKDFMPDTIENEGKLEYMTKRIKGRVAFIKQVDGEIGWLKLKRRLGDCEEYYNSFGLVFD